MSEKHSTSDDQPQEIVSLAEARDRGLKHYFTGQACKRGHVNERRTSTRVCVTCARIALSEQYKKNVEVSRGYQKKFRMNNLEKMREKDRIRYIENRDREMARCREYKARKAVELSEYSARYRSENKDLIRARQMEWISRNQEKRREQELRRRARKLRATPPWFGELDIFVWQEAAHLVVLRCAATGFDWAADHMIPLAARSARGLHVWNNCQVIPASMNASKNNKLVLIKHGEWLSMV